ncbi:hypothetical protein [Jiangella mangrovi]|uniref:Uncharacterized protein n=1 Tax=Jiangella mangrovi TaxID=1524084 RepID=A0A7W9GQR9_9ACTN|nr:hypothetical protein [Jiangella mangrovi]MBB5788313.1 hypothetical protein [Jiangella mangrovi]
MSSAYEAAAEALRNSRLYVDPDAETELEAEGRPFSDGERSAAEQTLSGASTPIFVAVLPAAAASDPDGLATIAQAVGEQGTYVAVLPDLRVNADSMTIDSTTVRDTAINVADASSDVSEFIESFTPQAEDLAAGGGGSGDATGSSGDGGGGLLPLAILAAAGGGGFLLYRRNKRSKERAQLEQVRGALDEDITKYGERLSELDLDLGKDSKVPIEARNEYGRALDLYENAKTFADRAEKPTDLKPVTTALEEGRWLLACVDARSKGEPIPERRLPCFFDPGHGPSVEDVEWAPMGGAPRTVPACAADAMRVKAGADPETRMVPVGDGERRPYYDAGPAYGGWAGGYFGGLLPGMLIGTMLGSAMSSPVYIEGGGDGGGGGDFGDGGFGGGDFGGGGFGGGDFGGGDFGGGFE